MIDYTTIRRDVEMYLNENFDECYIEFENTPLPEPEPLEMIRLFDTNGTSDSVGMGMPDAQIITGILTIMIFTKVHAGTERSRQIASVLSSLLAQKTIGSVQFSESMLVSTEQRVKNTYFQQNLYINYTVDFGGNSSSC